MSEKLILEIMELTRELADIAGVSPTALFAALAELRPNSHLSEACEREVEAHADMMRRAGL